jgi:cyanuric acid amidohydrolase
VAQEFERVGLRNNIEAQILARQGLVEELSSANTRFGKRDRITRTIAKSQRRLSRQRMRGGKNGHQPLLERDQGPEIRQIGRPEDQDEIDVVTGEAFHRAVMVLHAHLKMYQRKACPIGGDFAREKIQRQSLTGGDPHGAAAHALTPVPVAKIHRISANGPDDASGIADAISRGAINPRGVIAVFGKTEGNGCVNDFSRGFATSTLTHFFGRFMPPQDAAKICFVMSGGTEGAMAPHWTIFERSDGQGEPGPALAIGRAHTPALPPEDLGREGQIEMVAQGVREAMADAGIAFARDVHFVQVKCPLLTAQRIKEAESRGADVATISTLKSMGLSRAASALGAAVALGELDAIKIDEAAIGADWTLFSGRASCSAGIELLGHEIVVLGTSQDWSGPLSVDHAVMRDAIDIEPVRQALQRLGLTARGQLGAAEREKLVALLAKAEPSQSADLRGFRHTMLDDSDISPTRHARAFVCGALAGLVGHAEIFVSGGAEHQGPDGGGPVAVIVDRIAVARG